MRIIDEIPHPHLKITVFSMDNRLSVKFESGTYEQIYKFRSGEEVTTAADVRRIVDASFLEQVSATLQQMHRTRMAALSRQFPTTAEEEFEEII
jgi:hypothetical protein